MKKIYFTPAVMIDSIMTTDIIASSPTPPTPPSPQTPSSSNNVITPGEDGSDEPSEEEGGLAKYRGFFE